ncbi:357_t:CDS:2, partial [Diversispora eburnea]
SIGEDIWTVLMEKVMAGHHNQNRHDHGTAEDLNRKSVFRR